MFATRRYCILMLFILFEYLPITSQVCAEVFKVPLKVYSSTLHSGVVSNLSPSPRIVFSEVITLEDAPWIRLQFGRVQLEGSSYLLIRSHQDGETQFLNRQTLAEWRNSSAFFNGPQVTVELVAAGWTSSIPSPSGR